MVCSVKKEPVAIKAVVTLVLSNAKTSLLLFLPAWTFVYWQAWSLLVVMFISNMVITAYLIKNNQDLLERRIGKGHLKENDKIQKKIHYYISLSFDAIFVVCAIDHRMKWSLITPSLVMSADVVVALSFAIIFFVLRQNSFASSNIEVSLEQKVVSTGCYALVRHPLYGAGLILRAAIPLALGAWSGLILFIPSIFIFVWRISQEERFLEKNLNGYTDYQKLVMYRLIPFIW